MKNVNPLFLLVAAVFIFMISIFSLNQQHEKRIIEEQAFNDFNILAIKYNDLKSSWGNKVNSTKIIQKVLASSKIKNAKIVNRNDVLSVEIKNASARQINTFINKVLNEKIDINKLELKERSLSMEVGI